MSTKKAKNPAKPSVVKPRVVPDDLQAVVTEALRAAGSVPASQLKKALPKPYQAFDKEARELARALAHRGELYRWVKGKTEIFFARDPLATLDQTAPEHFAGKVLNKSALSALVASATPQHERLLDEWLPRALKRGLLFVHPGKQYGLEPPEPDVRIGLKPVFTALHKALESEKLRGISKQRIADALLTELGLPLAVQLAAAPPSRASNGSSPYVGREEFLAALQQLMGEGPQQALISVRELRARLTMGKQRFDELALELSREGVISLHHHDHPNSLSQVERSQLIRDARGTHYIAIAPRMG